MEDNYAIIDSYLDGSLEGEALDAFEQELRNNPELMKEVDLMRNMRDQLAFHFQIDAEERALRNTLGSIREHYPETEDSSDTSPSYGIGQLWPLLTGKWSIRVAAVVLILLGFWYLNKQVNERYTPERILEQAFVPLNLDDRGATTDLIANKDSANYLLVLLQSGKISLENKEYAQAAQALEIVLQEKDNPLYDRSNINFEASRWNLLLSQLMSADQSASLGLIDAYIAENPSKIYLDRATALRDRIASFWYRWVN